MDDTKLQQIATDLGVIEAAFPDILSRAERCFGDGTPTESELLSWAEGLRTEAPHLFGTPRGHTQGPSMHTTIPDWLNPSERLAKARQLGLATVHDKGSRRPKDYTPTAEQHKALAAISNPAERLAAYRTMRDAARQ